MNIHLPTWATLKHPQPSSTTVNDPQPPWAQYESPPEAPPLVLRRTWASWVTALLCAGVRETQADGRRGARAGTERINRYFLRWYRYFFKRSMVQKLFLRSILRLELLIYLLLRDQFNGSCGFQVICCRDHWLISVEFCFKGTNSHQWKDPSIIIL